MSTNFFVVEEDDKPSILFTTNLNPGLAVGDYVDHITGVYRVVRKTYDIIGNSINYNISIPR